MSMLQQGRQGPLHDEGPAAPGVRGVLQEERGGGPPRRQRHLRAAVRGHGEELRGRGGAAGRRAGRPREGDQPHALRRQERRI